MGSVSSLSAALLRERRLLAPRFVHALCKCSPANEGQFRRIDTGMLLRTIAEPPPEDRTPDRAQAAEDPESVSPQDNGCSVWRYRVDHQGQHGEGGQTARETACHPHRPLSEATFLEGEPIMERSGDVGVSAGLPHAKQETDQKHGREGQPR